MTEEDDEVAWGFGVSAASSGAMVSGVPGGIPIVRSPAAMNVLGAIGSPWGTPMYIISYHYYTASKSRIALAIASRGSVTSSYQKDNRDRLGRGEQQRNTFWL